MTNMQWPVVDWSSRVLPRTGSHESPINEMLLQPYRERVARIAHLLMNDSCDASHVIQETFQNLSCNTQRQCEDSSLRIRVFRTAVSTIRNRQRWWNWRDRFLHPPSDPTTNNEALVRHGLYCLSRSHRLILVLRDIEGLTYSEISEVLELPAGRVKTRLMRARTRMLNSVMQSRARMADRDQ
jgi:RNA polymerase sigma-70 factor (ECF subfamily)